MSICKILYNITMCVKYLASGPVLKKGSPLKIGIPSRMGGQRRTSAFVNDASIFVVQQPQYLVLCNEAINFS
jgi:hypothetical protein